MRTIDTDPVDTPRSQRGTSEVGNETTDALRRARQAQRAWGSAPAHERLGVVAGFRRALGSDPGSFVEATEEGRPRDEAEILASEVLPLADAAAFLEREGPALLALRRVPGSGPRWLGRSRVEIERIPLGVVLVIAPSNYPLFLAGTQVLQALAAGNAVLLKPAPGCAAAAVALADTLAGAGLPQGLLTVLPEDPAAATAAIDAGVDKVLLTGSARTGAAVAACSAATLTPTVMELSGCDAVFLLEDADPGLVAPALRFGLLLNGGATCIAPRRVFVPRRLLPAIERRLRAELEGTVDAIPLDDTGSVRALVDDALDRGGRVLVGGAIGVGGMRPTVLTDVPADAAVLTREVFAPLLSLVPVDSLAQALEIDRRCPFALGASIFGSPRAAHELADSLRAGVVVINDLIAPTADPRVAFGGGGRSGHGVTRGAEGLLELTRPRTRILRPGRFRPHYDPVTPATGRLLEGWLRFAHAGSLGERLTGVQMIFRALAQRGRPHRTGSGARQIQE